MNNVFTKSAVQHIVSNLRADSAGNEMATMTDLDLAADMLQAFALTCRETEEEPAPVITADTPVDYSNDTIREHAKHLARNEVYYCVSSLVSDVAQSHAAQAALAIDDDILSIIGKDDWENPAREYINGLEASDLKSTAEYLNVDGADAWDDDADDTKAMEAGIIAHCEADNSQWQELCYFNNLDPDRIEAYEHWIVSDWLAGQLESEGEIVARDFLGLTIWGRCTSGQAIAMDHVMLTIARDALAR